MNHRRSRSRSSLRAAIVLATAGALALSAASQAADGASCQKQKAAAPAGKAVHNDVVVRVVSIPQECQADDSAAVTGFRAFIDPATGELRAPTAEDEAALARALGGTSRLRAQAEMWLTDQGNGIFSYELGEDAMMDAVVRTGADGKPVFLCTPRSETAKALTRPLASTKAEEK